MKKISKFLFMFVGAFVTMVCGLQNVFASTLNYDFSGYWYERSDNGANYSSWKLENYYVDGNVAFCIEPGIPEGSPMQQGTWENTGLSNNIKQRVLLLAYYGYQYNGHQTQGYRAATQALIWETILGGNTRVTYSTARYGAGTPYNVDAERNVINSLVAQHYTKPSFNGTTVTAQVGTSVTLTDTNNVLSNYEVYASNNANVSINGNQLTITPTEIGNVTLQFVKKQIYSRSYLIYVGDGIQNMISGGNVDPVYFSVNLKALGGKVEINKVDSATMTTTPQGEASLSGAKFEIVDKFGNVVQTLTTDSNGYAISDYLPYFGRYTLREVNPSNGYLLSNEVVPFDSTKDSMLTYVKFKEDVITRDYEFTKIYSSDKTGIMTPEVGIKFGIYDKNNNLVKEETTDSEGKIYVTLPYGAYTLKQLTSTKNFEKIDDYKFGVREVGDTINKVFGNAEITARLKVIKVDSETGQVIERSNIKFRIFDVKNNEYVSQTITYPTAKTIDTFETDDNGILVTPYPLKNGTYYLEEVDQVIDGYLWNDKSVEFEIGEDANLITDNEFGILFEVKFENTQVKGSIEINKTGEEVELTDNGFVYNKINLEGVKIGLYANDDIYDALGNLKYKKDALVKELITDENGFVSLDNLCLGKYYLKEISTTNNHVLDTTKYSFELKYKDQYTAVITYTTTLENHLPKGTLEFTKTDFSTSETLPNTTITIYNENDEVVFTGKTDQDGKIIINDLPLGKYYIVETDAPEGYKLNEEKMYFEITEDGQVVKCNMTDEAFEVPSTGLSNINYELIGSIVLVISGLGLMIYGIKKRK
ncbi:MAG: SpaA isopeptide-forming pilin-related protein [Bacilli bacterium]